MILAAVLLILIVDSLAFIIAGAFIDTTDQEKVLTFSRVGVALIIAFCFYLLLLLPYLPGLIR